MRKLDFQEMENIQGAKLTPKQNQQVLACISAGLSALSMATGPWGILGLAGLALSAGACEGGKAGLIDTGTPIKPNQGSGSIGSVKSFV